MSRLKPRLEGPLVCQDPISLVKKCMKVVGQQLEHAGRISFRQVPHARSEQEYLLVSPQGSSARARQEYPVLYFGATQSKIYWLAVSLRFASLVPRFRLIHVSILLFEGPWSDPEKSPILRAEWDELEEGGGVHAQPHWHVYPAGAGVPRYSDIIKFAAVESEIVEFVPQAHQPVHRSFGLTELQERTRFHYAMAAQWHVQQNSSYQCSISEKGLLSWLGGCIEYIRGQLRYLSREDLIN